MAQRGRPFQPGNKFGRGRPRGSRNKRAVLVEELLAENSHSLLSQALKMAHEGNVPLLRLLLDRVLPRPKDAPVEIGPLPIGTPAELEQSQAKVMQELGLGQLTLHQAEQIFSLLDNRRRVLETHELAQHVRAIEDMFGTKISDICDTLHTPPKQSEL
jgi:hypothetical protein